MQANAALKGHSELLTNDLGPLAWVLDELRKSLAGATQSLRRFVREAQGVHGPDLAGLDASPVRQARQQLHQAAGALEMVGMAVPARIVRAMETLAQRLVQQPGHCNEAAVRTVERASLALMDYLEGALKGRQASPVALFPQYRDVQALVGEERVHPADLWPLSWHWQEVAVPDEGVLPLAYDSSVRARLDRLVLEIVKSGDGVAANAMRGISLGFAAEQKGTEPRAFWVICAAYFEAVSLGLCPPDVYGKRAASRILLQYRTLARGEPDLSERLVEDLLFFCAQAIPAQPADAPVLTAVRAAYGLSQSRAWDYENPQFGRFDPALLRQARKRIAAASETWAALAGGEVARWKLATEQFRQVSDSVLELHHEWGDLVQTLTQVLDIAARSGTAPAPALAMEVATAVLYLEAAYEDLDPTDSRMAERSASLGRRLAHVNAGGSPQPLEGWMEELYRRVSDRQIMGSVVDELRTTLGEVEKSLDAFFRQPLDKMPLLEVPGQLAQMRGVFSVLGLEHAARAALRMRESVDKFLGEELAGETARTGQFEKLGNSLGALGFLIDMLSYQRELAKQLFVFDETRGEFRPLMGREKAAAVSSPPAALPVEAAVAVVGRTPEPASMAQAAGLEEDEPALRQVFLDEARDVLQAGGAALEALAAHPSDEAPQITLRRAFHTLKGSARMVGLNEFGEAAWAMEQLFNAWLAEQKPSSAELVRLAGLALQGLERWVVVIAAAEDEPWTAQAFRQAADGLRLGQPWMGLVLPGDEGPEPAEAEAEADYPDFVSTQILDFGDDLLVEAPGGSSPADVEPSAPVEALSGLDWGGGSEAVASAAPLGEALADAVMAGSEPPSAPAIDVDVQQAGFLTADPEEQTKVIGSLRIGLSLYNVYLNEADEWSRCLLTELSEWALELHRPLSDVPVGLAHALGGSSATVGFVALAELARALEQALQHVQLQSHGQPAQAQVFVAAGEDIRRLLHQFAAGFLKAPDPSLLQQLKAMVAVPVPAPAMPAAAGLDPRAAADGASAAPLRAEGGEVLDALDVDLFPIFEEEALELLPQLGGALRQWTARPDNLGARHEALRILHTLKGSARLAGAMQLGEMAHQMESAIDHLGGVSALPAQLASLLSRFDALQDHFDHLRGSPAQVLSRPEAGPAVATSPATLPVPSRPLANQTVRVRAQLLDRLVNQAGEVMITRARLEARLGQLRGALGEMTGSLSRLKSQLRDLELQSESQMQSRLAQVKDAAQEFDPLELDRFTRVQELSRMMAESVHDAATLQRNLQRTVEGTEDELIAQARQARELQRDLLRTRMVEFEGIAERLYGVVRQAAKATGKPVKLDIQGGALEMDRGVLDRMAPVFEHLLRNAVVHGIEEPARRAGTGKPLVGTITIGLQQQGNDVTVAFGDDGGGLDLEQIRLKARAAGQLAEGASCSEAQVAELIFRPGLSTAPQVTELAGRGIGMDVVQSEVRALGGRIETATSRGQGTTFKLVLPLTTAVTQVVMLRVGERVIGVPANLVEMVCRVPAAELERAYQVHHFEFGGESVPFFWAGALLQASAHSHESRGKTQAVAVFRSAGQRVAAHVDEVLGNQEVVVKNLGPQLCRLPGLTGMSVLASGAVVLIYNPVALVSVYGEQARQLARTAGPAGGLPAATLRAAGRQAPQVLVVDDSITVRRVTQRLLKREGFRVALAADGLQALACLQQETPAVVLSDIEMPRMDGFDLARNIRADARWRELPIIMISSRSAERHREHARELGVDHYLGKPYSEDELIDLVRQHCAVQEQAVAE